MRISDWSSDVCSSDLANGTHVAEVEVDVETGMVRILRYSVAHDCGKVVNPMTVAGQVVGGVAHGVGNALYEWMRYDENAQPVTTNFGEYLLPLATEMPRDDQRSEKRRVGKGGGRTSRVRW